MSTIADPEIAENSNLPTARRSEGDIAPKDVPVRLRVEPTSGWASLKLGDLWAYRELAYFFVWRDLRVRYRQTILGASWAVLQPFLTMVVFTIFFGGLAGVPSDDVPYPIFSYAALVPWTFFANGVAQAAATLVSHPEMVKKIYFPRLLMPISAVAAGIVDFALAFVLLVGMMFFFGMWPTASVLWLPLFLLLATITALGTGFWLSAMNVQFRDVRYVVPFLLQLWLFITPVAYSSSLLSEPWQTIYGLNPMAGVVQGFRWALLRTGSAPGTMTLVSVVVSLALFVSGVYYFRRMERTFADVI